MTNYHHVKFNPNTTTHSLNLFDTKNTPTNEIKPTKKADISEYTKSIAYFTTTIQNDRLIHD